MADDGTPLAVRVTAWAFTHPHATAMDIMQEFHLTYVEAAAVIPQVHAVMDDLIARYPDPKDFAEQLLAWVQAQEGERHGQQQQQR